MKARRLEGIAVTPGDELVTDEGLSVWAVREYGTGDRRRVVCLVPGKGEFTFAPGDLRLIKPVEVAGKGPGDLVAAATGRAS